MGEVLEFEAGRDAVSPERREDIQEVLHYRAAMREAERQLQTLPLSERVVRAAHAVLLEGVRGQGKTPGEYRKSPNWIGAPGCTINEADFVPIAADRLLDAMGAWERYVHTEAPDRLVQLAILHVEFEALHPFLDGNGRLGRMLISSVSPCSTSVPTSRRAATHTTMDCSTDFVASSGIPKPTARRCLRVLREKEILKVLVAASGRRAAILGYPDLLNIAEGREFI